MTNEEEMAKERFISFIARMINKYGFLTDDETNTDINADDFEPTIDNR